HLHRLESMPLDRKYRKYRKRRNCEQGRGEFALNCLVLHVDFPRFSRTVLESVNRMIAFAEGFRGSHKPANFQYDPSPKPAWYRCVDSRIVLPCESGSSTIMRFDPDMSITCRQITAFFTSASSART